MAALDRVSGTPIAPVVFIGGQVRFEADASRHVPVLQQHAATLYHLSPAPVRSLRSE
jgi:hypothetical protein